MDKVYIVLSENDDGYTSVGRVFEDKEMAYDYLTVLHLSQYGSEYYDLMSCFDSDTHVKCLQCDKHTFIKYITICEGCTELIVCDDCFCRFATFCTCPVNEIRLIDIGELIESCKSEVKDKNYVQNNAGGYWIQSRKITRK